MSVYEEKGRLEKALTILSKVPHGATREEAEKIVGWLRVMAIPDRNVFSSYAGAKNPPSQETWNLVCKLAGERPTREEVVGDLGGVLSAAAAAVAWEKMTPASQSLFLSLVDDAGNWSGTPMIYISKESRGNLTQLKRLKVLTTFDSEGNPFATFTALGVAVAKTQGRDLSWVRS